MAQKIGEITLYVLTTSYKVEKSIYTVYDRNSQIVVLGEDKLEIPCTTVFEILKIAQHDNSVVRMDLDDELLDQIHKQAVADNI